MDSAVFAASQRDADRGELLDQLESYFDGEDRHERKVLDFAPDTGSARHEKAPSVGKPLFSVLDASRGEPSSAARKFLIISAPFGPFSRELALALRQQGASVHRVILNAGDLLDWGWSNAHVFSRRQKRWERWLEAVLARGRFTDVITYGDTSYYAAKALQSARALGLRTHILEQGYFRPNWVTLEGAGVNAHSDLPRDPDWYRRHPAANAPAQVENVGLATPSAVRHIVAYHGASYLGAVAFPFFRFGYQHSALVQAAGHVARFVGQKLKRRADERLYEHLSAAAGQKMFLVLLQRPGDSQLWRHSRFRSVEEFIGEVCANFAQHAPKDAQLLIRPHPLDPGLTAYQRLLVRIARRHRLEGRVRFFDWGKLHEVLPHMAGVVCVNSTAGLAGVEFGLPTIALGRAIYDMPGLTHQGKLSAFWREASPPDRDLYAAYRRVVMAVTQVNGGFATVKGRGFCVPAIVERLTQRSGVYARVVDKPPPLSGRPGPGQG